MAPTLMLATVPPGMGEGSQFIVRAPNGAQVMVTLPAGLSPGDQFHVAVPPAAASSSRFRDGDEVTLTSLPSTGIPGPMLNGSVGRIHGQIRFDGKYSVHLEDGVRRFLVPEDNLVAGAHPELAPAQGAASSPAAAASSSSSSSSSAAAAFATGATVTLLGLQSASGSPHNGKVGRVIDWDGGKGRYNVVLRDGTKLSLRPQNMAAAEASSRGPSMPGVGVLPSPGSELAGAEEEEEEAPEEAEAHDAQRAAQLTVSGWKPLQRHQTLADWNSLDDAQKQPWLWPRLLLFGFALLMLVIGCILKHSPKDFVGGEYVRVQNPSITVSKNRLLGAFGELLVVPSAAVLATMLVYVFAELQDGNLWSSTAEAEVPATRASERCWLLAGLSLFHAFWIACRAAVLFDDTGTPASVVVGATLLLLSAMVAMLAVALGCAARVLRTWQEEIAAPRRRTAHERHHDATLPLHLRSLYALFPAAVVAGLAPAGELSFVKVSGVVRSPLFRAWVAPRLRTLALALLAMAMGAFLSSLAKLSASISHFVDPMAEACGVAGAAIYVQAVLMCIVEVLPEPRSDVDTGLPFDLGGRLGASRELALCGLNLFTAAWLAMRGGVYKAEGGGGRAFVAALELCAAMAYAWYGAAQLCTLVVLKRRTAALVATSAAARAARRGGGAGAAGTAATADVDAAAAAAAAAVPAPLAARYVDLYEALPPRLPVRHLPALQHALTQPRMRRWAKARVAPVAGALVAGFVGVVIGGNAEPYRAIGVGLGALASGLLLTALGMLVADATVSGALPSRFGMHGLAPEEQWRLKLFAPLLFNCGWLLCVGANLATSVDGDGDVGGDDLGDGGLRDGAGTTTDSGDGDLGAQLVGVAIVLGGLLTGGVASFMGVLVYAASQATEAARARDAEAAARPLLCRVGLVRLVPSDSRSQVELRAPAVTALVKASVPLALLEFIVACVLMSGGYGASGLGAMVGAVGTCMLLLSFLNLGGLAVMRGTNHVVLPDEEDPENPA